MSDFWQRRRQSGALNRQLLATMLEDLHSGKFDEASDPLLTKLEKFLVSPSGHNRIALVHELRLADDKRVFHKVVNPG